MDQESSRRLSREIVLDQTGGIELMIVSSRMRRRQSGLRRLPLGSTAPLESSIWFKLVIRSRCPHPFANEYYARNTLKDTPLFTNLINQIIHSTKLTQPTSDLFLANRNLMTVRRTAVADRAQHHVSEISLIASEASIVGKQSVATEHF